MAKNTKIIKLTNGTYTYVPVTLADAVQYSYEGGAMSVQQAIGTLATSQISIAEHLHDQGTDLQTHSTSVISNVGYITLSQNEDKVYIKNGGSSTATSTYAHVGITTEGTKGLILKVSYTDTKPASANFSVSDGSTSKIAFGSNESTAKTLTIKGATGTPIETAVSQSGNTTTVDIKHKNSGVTAGTYGTNSTTTISAGSTGSIVVPQVEVNSYGHVTSASNQSISIDLSGLTGAMHWVGVSSTDPKGSSGATFSGHTTWSKGDVVTYNSKEYVLSGDSNAAANWLELGDEGSHALKGTTTCSPGDGLTGTTMYAYVTGSNGSIQHAVPTNASAGKKDSADNNFIKSVTTDKFGHVTAYTTGTFTQDHTKSGTITAGQLTYWNSATTHTAVTNSYGNSSSKYAYVDGGVLKEGTLPTAPNNYSQIAINAQATSTTAEVADGKAITLAPASSTDKLNIESVNKWVQIKGTSGGANTDKIQIAHDVLWTGTPSATQTLYKFTYDNAGHITAVTSVSADKVIGSVTSNYKIVEGNAIDDLDSNFLSSLGLSGNTGNDIATGNQTTNNYYHS